MELQDSRQLGCIAPASSETDLGTNFATAGFPPAAIRVKRSPVLRTVLQDIIGSPRGRLSLLVCWDLGAIAVAVESGYLLSVHYDYEVGSHIGLWTAVVFWGVVFVFSALSFGLYERSSGESRVTLILRSTVATVVSWTIVLLSAYAVTFIAMEHRMAAFSLLIVLWATVTGRLILRYIESVLPVNVIVLGDREVARSIRLEKKRRPYPPLRVLATSSAACDVTLEFLTGVHSTLDAGGQDQISWIIIQGHCEEATLEQLLPFVRSGTRLCNLSMFFETFFQKVPVEVIDNNWLVQADVSLVMTATRVVKRSVDVLGALVGLALTLPVWPAVALMIKLSSTGPVFYAQERIGCHGKVFRIFKFRTMTVGAESGGKAVWASREDPRITPVGSFLRKTRLDEIPQFLNVLLGHMSLVGPRPERPEFVQMLTQEIPHYQMRHLIRPGITGWAQINYRYGASIDDAVEKLKYDLYYLKYGGLFLDVQIMVRTIGMPMRGSR